MHPEGSDGDLKVSQTVGLGQGCGPLGPLDLLPKGAPGEGLLQPVLGLWFPPALLHLRLSE